jgi:hypothetical protein
MTLTKVVGGVIADGTIASVDITDSTITNAKMALSPANASNLSSGDVPSAQLDNIPTEGLQADIALLAFKTQANGSLARYNLVDQSVDAFEDATGISASDSTNEVRDSSEKYFVGGSAGDATGGTITYSGGKTIHSFTSSGTFTVPGGSASVAYLVIAGGGGAGGGQHAGGGGGGGYRNSFASETSGGGGSTETPLTMVAGGHTVTVGGGGDGKLSQSDGGGNGEDSVFSTITSTGGGGGGYWRGPGSAGGSGGGGGGGNNEVISGGSGTSNQGYAGGAYTNTGASNGAGAGGGGAGAVGQDTAAGYQAASGNGGAGLSSSITGASVGRGGGGGGSGGSGGTATDGGGARPGNPGTANTGGGGAGFGSTQPAQGGDGGSGIVIASYTTDAFITEGANMTLESITTTTATAPTKGDLVFTYTDGAGTAVVGTNITAEYSADAGSTWTDFGIAASDSQGTTGGHTIVTKNNVSLTSTSGTNMRYRIKTLVQSVSLSTRIHAVSLGWS